MGSNCCPCLKDDTDTNPQRPTSASASPNSKIKKAK